MWAGVLAMEVALEGLEARAAKSAAAVAAAAVPCCTCNDDHTLGVGRTARRMPVRPGREHKVVPHHSSGPRHHGTTGHRRTQPLQSRGRCMRHIAQSRTGRQGRARKASAAVVRVEDAGKVVAAAAATAGEAAVHQAAALAGAAAAAAAVAKSSVVGSLRSPCQAHTPQRETQDHRRHKWRRW